jgi:hypothetical protein
MVSRIALFALTLAAVYFYLNRRRVAERLGERNSGSNAGKAKVVAVKASDSTLAKSTNEHKEIVASIVATATEESDSKVNAANKPGKQEKRKKKKVKREGKDKNAFMREGGVYKGKDVSRTQKNLSKSYANTPDISLATSVVSKMWSLMQEENAYLQEMSFKQRKELKRFLDHAKQQTGG